MEQIESINLRNNPIKYLPDRLCEMVNLRILNLSHCFLSELAPWYAPISQAILVMQKIEQN